MRYKLVHMCLDIEGGIRNARMLKDCITVDGKRLHTEKEIKDFLRGELSKGRRVLPMADCDNFDYQTGCKGHYVEDEEQAVKEEAANDG